MQTVKQVYIEDDKGGNKDCVRWDNVKQLLYKQNRSYDLHICLDDFLNRLNHSITMAKSRGFKIEVKDVAINEPWPTTKGVK